MSRFFPFLAMLKSYNKQWLRGDLAAGVTVGIMLIPQGMAYAMIAGLPPIYGLYASTLPLIIYGLLGTSRQLAVGPVAMVSLLTAAGIGALAESGTQAYISHAISLALMVGLIQFTLGFFKLGFLVNFLSHPVISGFTSAAALIIGLSQLKHLLGIELARSHHVHEIILQAARHLSDIHLATFLIGIAGIALILLLKKINKKLPGLLIAVVLGILIVWGFGLNEHGVKIVGEVPKGLPLFGMPAFSSDIIQALIPTALAISLVSFMESIAVAKAVQAKHRDYKVEPNQELIALGLSNIGGSLFQSYPVTGGFSRTAVNDQAGAKTGISSLISALLIILTLLFLTPLFYFLPNAILASVIMVAVFGLIDFEEVKYLWHTNRSDFWMLVVTFMATLALGIEIGIGIGVVLSLAIIIFKTTRPHIAILGRIPGTSHFRNVERFEEVEVLDDVLIIRFDAQLYFANINFFKEQIEEQIVEKGAPLRAVIINAESINNVDSSAIHALTELQEELSSDNIKLIFAGVKGPVRDAFQISGLTDQIGASNFTMSIQEAIDKLDQVPGVQATDSGKYALQSNGRD